MHTVNLLTNLVFEHQVLAYGLILFGLIFEGEFIIISSGILAHLGALNFWFVLGFIYLGGAGKTLCGYYLGRMMNRKWHNVIFFKYLEKRVSNILPNFSEKSFWSIFISKFIMGINNIVILFSGYKNVPFKKFIKAEAISTLIWAPLLLSLGYFFSYTALGVSKEIWRFLLVVAVLVILFIIIDRFIGWLYVVFQGFYAKDNNNENNIK